MSEDNKNNRKLKHISKHKESGKHKLNYDTIFKGKKQEPLEEDYTIGYFNDDFSYDPQSHYYFETQNNDEYVSNKNLKDSIYKILVEKTDLNFKTSRRKPSKKDFNKYYDLLVTELEDDAYTNIEIFNELSYYFSDNLFNMFKLLNSKWRNTILEELQEHIGKTPETSKDVMPRNLSIGAEIEFTMLDENGEDKVVTGVIKDTDHENRIYDVDSFECIYEVPIECINKILNNQKFKYNLNKLNNLDIL